jgi:hypothetical protein
MIYSPAQRVRGTNTFHILYFFSLILETQKERSNDDDVHHMYPIWPSLGKPINFHSPTCMLVPSQCESRRSKTIHYTLVVAVVVVFVIWSKMIPMPILFWEKPESTNNKIMQYTMARCYLCLSESHRKLIHLLLYWLVYINLSLIYLAICSSSLGSTTANLSVGNCHRRCHVSPWIDRPTCLI